MLAPKKSPTVPPVVIYKKEIDFSTAKMTKSFHTYYTKLVCEGNPYVSLNLQSLRLRYLESELDDVILVDLFAESVHFNFW